MPWSSFFSHLAPFILARRRFRRDLRPGFFTLWERDGVDTSVTAFFLSKFELTQAQWFRMTGRNPSLYYGGKSDVSTVAGRVTFSKPITLLHPVEQVSWDEATSVLWQRRTGRISRSTRASMVEPDVASSGRQRSLPAGPIAIVGAGIAAARELRAAGREVFLFDKGRSVGGRVATRRRERWQWDHGAQFATVRDPAFAAAVARSGRAPCCSSGAGRADHAWSRTHWDDERGTAGAAMVAALQRLVGQPPAGYGSSSRRFRHAAS
jgi:hypothetical protein